MDAGLQWFVCDVPQVLQRYCKIGDRTSVPREREMLACFAWRAERVDVA